MIQCIKTEQFPRGLVIFIVFYCELCSLCTSSGCFSGGKEQPPFFSLWPVWSLLDLYSLFPPPKTAVMQAMSYMDHPPASPVFYRTSLQQILLKLGPINLGFCGRNEYFTKYTESGTKFCVGNLWDSWWQKFLKFLLWGDFSTHPTPQNGCLTVRTKLIPCFSLAILFFIKPNAHK